MISARPSLIGGGGPDCILCCRFWMQPHVAPIVYIVPGLGSHRLADSALALAELWYDNGFSVVCVSSAFNSEFMESASTVLVPAYPPVDAHDLHVALTEIDHRLE